MFDFLQCIENNTHVSFQIGNDLCYVLSVGDNFNALIVRIVSNSERSFYWKCKFPRRVRELVKQTGTFVSSLPHLFFRFDKTTRNEVLILIGRDQARCPADILRVEGQFLRLVTQGVLQFSAGREETGAVGTQTFILTAKAKFNREEVTLECQTNKVLIGTEKNDEDPWIDVDGDSWVQSHEQVLLGTSIVFSAISRKSWTLSRAGRTQMRRTPLPLPSDWYHPLMLR